LALWRNDAYEEVGMGDVVEDARELLERLLEAYRVGELEASAGQVAALVGALSALSSLPAVRDTTV